MRCHAADRVERDGHGIRLLAPPERKRQIIELLWSAGCDVIRVNPVKDSLEEVFLHLVEHGGAA